MEQLLDLIASTSRPREAYLAFTNALHQLREIEDRDDLSDEEEGAEDGARLKSDESLARLLCCSIRGLAICEHTSSELLEREALTGSDIANPRNQMCSHARADTGCDPIRAWKYSIDTDCASRAEGVRGDTRPRFGLLPMVTREGGLWRSINSQAPPIGCCGGC